MQSTSAFWQTAMEADTLNIISYATVLPPLQANTDIPLATFPVTTGQVTIDSTNAVRRSLSSLLMVPQAFDPYGQPVPEGDVGNLFPDGNEVIVYKGCLYPDTPFYADAPTLNIPWVNAGAPTAGEVMQLGRFLMEDVEIYNDSSNGALYVEVNGSDRSATVSRAVFTAPYTTDGQSETAIQIWAILVTQVSGLTFNFPATNTVAATANFSIGDDPWQSAQQVAASVGYELFFDAFGICTLRLVPNPATIAPVWSYVDGDSNVVDSVQRSLINTGVPNLIILISQGSNVPVPIQSVWWDSNPDSSTFYNATAPVLGSSSTVPSAQGTYPTTTVTSTSSTATTQLANDQAAQSVFLGTYGSFETVDIKLRDNPAHDVEDVITVTSVLAGAVDANYILDTITIQVDYSTEQEMKGRLVVPS